MDGVDIPNLRLRSQHLTGNPLPTPEAVVSGLGAVQAQEYLDSKWALALRSRRTSDTAIERALSAGRILRTHVLRPTWHFVTAADIRWMLALTGPRIAAALASYFRRMELDAAVFEKSERAIARALRGGVHLTRQELKAALQRAGVSADGPQRLAFIVIQAEIDAVICSGARRGTQHTYALLDERVPAARALSRDAALAELARRYFTGHGPAQLHDFAWWSGLTVRDARAGLEMVAAELTADVVLDAARWTRVTKRDPFSAPVVVNGQVVAGWKTVTAGRRLVITVTPFGPLNRRETSAIRDAARRYAAFVGLESELRLP